MAINLREWIPAGDPTNPNPEYYYNARGEMLQPQPDGTYRFVSAAADGGGPDGNAYGRTTMTLDASGNPVPGSEQWAPEEHDGTWMGNEANTRLFGVGSVLAIPAAGAALAAGAGTAAGTAATGAGTGALSAAEVAAMEEAIQAGIASMAGAQATPMTAAQLAAAVSAAGGSLPSIFNALGELMPPATVGKVLAGAATSGILPNLVRGITSALTGGGSVLDALKGLVTNNPTFGGLLGAGTIAALGLDLYNKNNTAGDTLAADTTKAGGDYATTMTDAANTAKTDYTKVGTDTADAYKTLGADTGQAWSNLAGTGIDMWNLFGDNANAAYTQAGKDIKKTYDDAATTGKTGWTNLGDEYAGKYDALGDKAQSAWEGVGAKANKLWTGLGDTGQAGYDALGNEVKGAYDTLGDAMRADYTTLGREGQERLTDLGTTGKIAWEDTGATNNQIYRDVGDELSAMFSDIGTTGNTRLTNVGSEFTPRWEALGDEYADRGSAIGQKWYETGRGIADEAKGMAGTFTPYTVTSDVGTFDSSGKWTLSPEYQKLADSAKSVSQKSYDAAEAFNPETMRADEYALMQQLWQPYDTEEQRKLEARMQAQGRLGLQSFSSTNAVTDPTGTYGAAPELVALYQGQKLRNVQGYKDADDQAMKRRAEWIAQANDAMKNPLAFDTQGQQWGQLAGDLGTRAFNARKDAASMWGSLAMDAVDYGYKGDIAGFDKNWTADSTGLGNEYDAAMEGARFNNTQDVTGVTRRADNYVSGADAQVADNDKGTLFDLTKQSAGVDYMNTESEKALDTDFAAQTTGVEEWATDKETGLKFKLDKSGEGVQDQIDYIAKGTGANLADDEKAIDTNRTLDEKGQTLFDTRTDTGLEAKAEGILDGLAKQAEYGKNGVNYYTGTLEEAIKAVAGNDAKAIEAVKTATNTGLDNFNRIWKDGQDEKLDATLKGIGQKFTSRANGLRMLGNIYNAIANRIGGAFSGSSPTGAGATPEAAIGNIINTLTSGGGMTEQEATDAIWRVIGNPANDLDPNLTADEIVDMLMGDYFSPDYAGGTDWTT